MYDIVRITTGDSPTNHVNSCKYACILLPDVDIYKNVFNFNSRMHTANIDRIQISAFIHLLAACVYNDYELIIHAYQKCDIEACGRRHANDVKSNPFQHTFQVRISLQSTHNVTGA